MESEDSLQELYAALSLATIAISFLISFAISVHISRGSLITALDAFGVILRDGVKGVTHMKSSLNTKDKIHCWMDTFNCGLKRNVQTLKDIIVVKDYNSGLKAAVVCISTE